ncbi:MAG: twin-arginine translocation pathway signal protein, partial [Sulfurifustaceae bacterium]
TDADVVILGRIAPVVLAGALPRDAAQLNSAIAEIIAGIDMTIGYEPPAVRKEIRDLFNLLGSGVTRSLVAGMWQPWENASNESIQKFLTSWRNSRFDLLRSAYIGLTGLIIGSWYGNPRSWERIGYPGPPRIA